MAKENLVDSFYTLGLDLVGDKAAYKKTLHLQKCAPPKQSKVKDEVTATDDHEEVFVVVDFKKTDEIEFEIVYDKAEATHAKLDQMYKDNSIGHFEFYFVQAHIGKTFDGQLVDWEEIAETKTQKLRKKGKLAISNLADITTSKTAP